MILQYLSSFACFFLQGTVPGREKKQCSICLKPRTNPEVLPRCRHSFCKSCIDNMPKKNRFCEVCGLLYGPAQGNQPVGGTMKHIYENDFLPGYEDYGTIAVEYHIPNGLQGKEYLKCNAISYWSTLSVGFFSVCNIGRAGSSVENSVVALYRVKAGLGAQTILQIIVLQGSRRW